MSTRSDLLLRFAEIDVGRHQSSDPIPIPKNRYNVLFIRNDKLLAFIVACKPGLIRPLKFGSLN
jgi:hypothetical protein